MNNTKDFFYGIEDAVFKSIIFNYNEDFSLWFFKRLLRPLNVIRFNNIVFKNVERPINEVKEKRKRMDVLVSIDDKYIINIEVDTSSTISSFIKNYAYRCSLYSELYKSGDKYSDDLIIVGIDIRMGLSSAYDEQDVMLVQSNLGNPYIQNFVILVYNVDKIKNYWYNLDIEKINYYAEILMLVLNESELKKLITYLTPDVKKYVSMFVERIIEMNETPDFYIPWTVEHERFMTAKIDKEEAYKKGTKEGIEQGIEQGTEQEKIKITKKMLSDGLSPETIKKYVSLSLKKINEIKLTML